MRYSFLRSPFALLVLLASAPPIVTAQLDECQPEKETVDTCFDNNCPDCDPVDFDINFDSNTPISELQNAVDADVSTAKDCCPACSDEIDALADCVKPGFCVGDLCLGDDSGIGSNGIEKTYMILTAAVMGLGFGGIFF